MVVRGNIRGAALGGNWNYGIDGAHVMEFYKSEIFDGWIQGRSKSLRGPTDAKLARLSDRPRARIWGLRRSSWAPRGREAGCGAYLRREKMQRRFPTAPG